MQSRKILWLFIGCLFFKFILFDLDWSLNTTFSSFSFPQTYLTKFLQFRFFIYAPDGI